MIFDKLAGVSPRKAPDLKAIQTKPGQHKVLVIFEEWFSVDCSNLAAEVSFFLVVKILCACHSWYLFISIALSEGCISDTLMFSQKWKCYWKRPNPNYQIIII